MPDVYGKQVGQEPPPTTYTTQLIANLLQLKRSLNQPQHEPSKTLADGHH